MKIGNGKFGIAIATIHTLKALEVVGILVIIAPFIAEFVEHLEGQKRNMWIYYLMAIQKMFRRINYKTWRSSIYKKRSIPNLDRDNRTD